MTLQQKMAELMRDAEPRAPLAVAVIDKDPALATYPIGEQDPFAFIERLTPDFLDAERTRDGVDRNGRLDASQLRMYLRCKDRRMMAVSKLDAVQVQRSVPVSRLGRHRADHLLDDALVPFG